MKDEDLQAVLSMALSIPMIGFSSWIIWKQLGGWRGVKSKYFLAPLGLALAGIVLSMTVSIMMRERVPGVEWVPNPAWMGTALWVGIALFTVGLMAAPLLPTLRFVMLSRIMRRLDDYVEGDAPLPLPDDDATHRDLQRAQRLLSDPALVHRFDPVVVARVEALQGGRPLPSAVPARD
jgi:hypothetical protein